MRGPCWIVIALTLAAAAGCADQAPPPPEASEEDAAGAALPASGGVIEASVKYGGESVIEKIKISKDTKVCGREAEIEKIVVGPKGGLENAVVSVTGLQGASTGKVAKAQIDQNGCQFRPSVVAMQTGEIDILNSDGILHNVHTYSTANPPINKAQPKFKKVLTETLEKPEIIKITCDVHSWMVGWIAVLPHPYFGLTDSSGLTKVEDVPPGKLTVEVWHPILGRQKKEVEVRAGETSSVAFAFEGR